MTYEQSSGTSHATTVSALFDSQAEAQGAINELQNVGIRTEQIHMVEGGTGSQTPVAPADQEKGFWDSLSDFFLPDEDQYTYVQGLSRGGYLVTVTPPYSRNVCADGCVRLKVL